MKYEAFIFDFDFTLADATPGIVESFNYALCSMGYEARGTDEIRKTVGMSLADSFAQLTLDLDNKKAEKFSLIFRKKADEVMTKNTILLPHTIDVLTQLKMKNAKTAIVTSKLRYRIEDALLKFNITKLIDYIVGFEDVEKAKPSPEGVLKAIEHLKINKNNVLYIGDSTIDAQTAVNASVDFAAVTTGTTSRAEFTAFPYKIILNDLSGLMDFIYQLH